MGGVKMERVRYRQERIYRSLHKIYKAIALSFGNTEDQANRIAALGAVKNTQKEWRRQHVHS